MKAYVKFMAKQHGICECGGQMVNVEDAALVCEACGNAVALRRSKDGSDMKPIQKPGTSHQHSGKMRRCVDALEKQGMDPGMAHRICYSSTGG